MVCDERLASFINSFNTDYDEVVTSIRREAEENRVPIIRTRGWRVHQDVDSYEQAEEDS